MFLAQGVPCLGENTNLLVGEGGNVEKQVGNLKLSCCGTKVCVFCLQVVMGLDRAWSGSFIPSGASLGQFQNRDQLPQGAILVPRDNMIDLMYRRMELWKPRSEM